MPKRFITYSRTEPARTILFTVSILTAVMQTLAVIFTGGLSAVLNLALVLGICVWGTWSAANNSVRQMSMSSFWLFVMWLYSALVRLLVTTGDPTQLLFFPMLVVAVVLATVYLYLSHKRAVGIDE